MVVLFFCISKNNLNCNIAGREFSDKLLNGIIGKNDARKVSSFEVNLKHFK